jgi:hypothetical protein
MNVINLILCFAVAGIHDVPVYGWTDEGSKYLQNRVHNRCNMLTDWAWFTFLKQYVISLLKFYKYLITIAT